MKSHSFATIAVSLLLSLFASNSQYQNLTVSIRVQNSQDSIPVNPSIAAPTGPQAGGTLFMPLVTSASTPSTTTNDGWWTVAGNSERTSSVPEAVSGNLHLEWYRPIDAYISQNTQIIASNGLLYISTARGLYALDAATGNLSWRFDTELPLGNSPTVSGGVVYVGGFDHKIHALDARTGLHLWSFDGATAGYSSNPLVVSGMVIAGNRDGFMYAIGAQGSSQQGKLIWKFKTGGPIMLTAAEKNGVVYFAANDNYAYALKENTTNINGELVWKSQKMPGDGYQSYWPVITTDPATGKDLIIFTTASAYRSFSSPGTRSVKNCPGYDPTDPTLYPCDIEMIMHFADAFNGITNPDGTLGPVVPIQQPWAQGKTIIDYSRVIDYLENNPSPNSHLHKPWRRSYVILNASDGKEYSFDSNHNGFAEYTPVIPFATKNGTFYPPVEGKDGLLYFSNMYYQSWQGRVMGWRLGTPYFSLGPIQGAADEPQALSGGGDMIYRNLCCDRVGDYYDTSAPNNSSALWGYFSPLADQAPGYDPKWWFLDAGLERLYGNYGGPNGIYHNHGDQNPIVPYNGRLYVHRSNTIIAYGTGPAVGMLPKIDPKPVQDVVPNPSLTELKARLEVEVQKMILAGHLRPGYYNNGQFGDVYYILNDYFDNPGDTLYTLTKAYPYLSSTLQAQTRTYLQTEFKAYFDPVMYSHIGWADGAGREAMPLPPEVQADLVNYPKSEDAGYGWGWSWHYPQYNFYGMWKYAQIFPSDALKAYGLAKNKLEVPVSSIATNAYLTTNPWELNGYIAGYIGFLNLQDLANQSGVDSQLRAQVNAELTRLQNLRVANFTKDTPYTDMASGYTHRTMNISRNFLMLVPELGDYLNQNILAKVQAAVTEYNTIGPYWLATRYNGSIGEAGRQNLYDVPAMFQAKAYILKEPRSTLVKYLDVPAFEKGDLFYIQNLIATIEAP